MVNEYSGNLEKINYDLITNKHFKLKQIQESSSSPVHTPKNKNPKSNLCL
jgi:hypothetical protein